MLYISFMDNETVNVIRHDREVRSRFEGRSRSFAMAQFMAQYHFVLVVMVTVCLSRIISDTFNVK